jgi:phospholipase D1/2
LDVPFFSLSSLLAQVLVSQGGVDDGGAASVRAIMHWQYRTICRGQNSVLHNLYDLLGPKTQDYISFYGLRAYGQLSNGGPVVTSQVCIDLILFITSSISFLPSL